MITITSLKNLGTSSPTQWVGESSGGHQVYIRYRHGRLRMDVRGKTIHQASIGSEYSGYMTDEDLRLHLAEVASIDCEIENA